MKYLKRIGVLFLTLIIIYIILAFFGPKNYLVERSIKIDAPKDIVFEQISKFGNWENWSPWKEKDSTADYILDGEDGVIGTKYEWTGNPEITGKGSMIINELIPNEKFGYDLAFTEPWEMRSKGAFELKGDDESTNLRWYDKGNIPFMQRPFMLFMDLEEMMGPDFERGLEKIDSLSMIEKLNQESNKNLSETQFSGGKYLGVKHLIKISELDSSIYANSFALIGEYIAENNITPIGAPCSITTKWDEETDSCEIIIGFPVEQNVNPAENNITYIDIPSRQSILYKYYGDYNKMGTAYDEIHSYLTHKGINGGDFAIEEYITDPTTVENENEILTNIYYLIK